MDLNRARETPIVGYVHPDSTNVQRSGKYKTFTEGKKAKKNEKFGTRAVETQYAISDIIQKEEFCIVCKEISVHVCPCAYNDKTCSNNHTWYTDREGNVKVGNPH
jgi:hypothetical protein